MLRAAENKVPKLRFLFTRTSMPYTASDESPSPLHSTNNVEFEKTAKNDLAVSPHQSLTGKTKDIAKVLGFNCGFIFSKMRMQRMANKVIKEIDIKHEEIKKLEKPKIADSITQTGDYKCPTCLVREAKKYVTVGIQNTGPRKLSVKTQTDEEDYRHPLIQTLARMTAAQLIAMADFAKLMASDRPTTANEMFQLRERLMDIYNLGQRDSDAVKEAERKRMLERSMDEQQQQQQQRSGPIGMGGGPSFNQMHPMNNMGGGGGMGMGGGGGAGGMGGGGGGGGMCSGNMNKNNMNDIASVAMNMGMGNMNEMANIMANVNNMNNGPPQMNNMNNNMGRGGDYRLDDEDQALLRAEEIEQEREMRYQQIRYEQELRNLEMEEERRMQMQQQQQYDNSGPNGGRGGGGGGGWQHRGQHGNSRFRGRPSPWAR